MARPQNISAAKIAACSKTHLIVPAGKVTLPLEQFRWLQSITFGWQAVGSRLIIGILEFVGAPPDRALRKDDIQTREAIEHARKEKISHHRDRAHRTNHIAECVCDGGFECVAGTHLNFGRPTRMETKRRAQFL